MAVAGLGPPLPSVTVPVVPVPLQGMPLPPYQPGQLLQQPAYPAPGFYGPSSYSLPQLPPQPQGKPRHNAKARPWKPRTDFQQQATGVPNFEQLRWENSKKTQRAFGPAAGSFANRPARNGFHKAQGKSGQKLCAGAGVQKPKNHKKWSWKHKQPSRQGQPRQQPASAFRKPRGFPARAQTPATIMRTPATVQRTPSMVQQTPAAASMSHPEGTTPFNCQRRRRRLSQDPDNALLGAELDFFGTNQGLIMRRSASLSSSTGSDADDSDSDSEPARDYEQRLGDDTSAAPVPFPMQAHTGDQADQIHQLEVDNARLADDNINLRERIFVMEKEMAELRNAGAASTEEDTPQQWFGMAESDFVDEDAPRAPTVSPEPMQAAPQVSEPASPANATPSSHTPVMIDVQ